MLTTETIVGEIQTRFPGAIEAISNPNPHRLFLTIKRDSMVDVADYVFNTMNARLIRAWGIDKREWNGYFEMAYLFSLDRHNIILSLRELVDPDNCQVFSIANVCRGANWHEREIYDLMGIFPKNHPDPRRLILADDWPEDLFPQRQDFPHDFKPPIVKKVVRSSLRDPKGEEKKATVLSVGPFFPTLEEPAYFKLYVEGEQIVGADYRGFFSHRGVEKLGDTVLDYNKIPFIAERICGICGFVHSSSYCMAVEDAANIEIPPRAKYIRTILLELERVHSHLLWLGLAAHIIGFDTVLMQSWRIREPIMWLMEAITGNRKTYGMNLVGGVRRDLTPELCEKILETIDKVEAESKKVIEAIVGDSSLMMRMQGVGVLSQEDARRNCCVGPTARASGIKIDTRIDHPYLAYPELDFDIAVYPGGDVWARTVVRATELMTSFNLIRQAVRKLPPGEIMADVQPIPPWQEGIGIVEAPRGECCHYVQTGLDNKPFAWRVRAATYPQLFSVPDMLKNMDIADFPIIVGSVDPCFSCTERVVVVDTKAKNVRVYRQDELLSMTGRTKR